MAQSPLNSLDFDGTDDFVLSAIPPVFIGNNDFTMEAWVKPESTNFSRVIFAEENSSNFTSISIFGDFAPPGEVFFYFYKDLSFGSKTLSSFPIGVWTHLAYTWDATNSLMNIYVDGILQSTGPSGSSSTGDDNVITIGAKAINNNGDATQLFQGELDEVRIWNVVRSNCEISKSMSSEFNSLPANLVRYYKFNQGTPGGTNTGINTLPDLVSMMNGNLLNFNLTGSSSNWVSSAAGINTLNDYGYVTSTDIVTACDSYTWIDGNTYTTSNNTATQVISTADTILAGSHASNFIDNLTRGYYFQAQSSFNIISLRCADEAGPNAARQSVEVVDFGTNPPGEYGTTSSHTVLYSSIDVPAGEVACDVNIVVGNYYGIIGAKHDAVGGALDMYNSYATEPTVTIDGNATTLKRCILQDNLYNGSPATSNSYFSEAFKPSIGRIHFTIAQCDSTVTLDLTINNSNTSTDVVTACDSYTWIDGNTYTTSNNTATQVISTADTILAGSHASNFIDNLTRGYYFQAQSSFNIISLRCADEAGPNAARQSVEVVDFGTNPPGEYGTTSSHTVLYSSIDVPAGEVACDVNIVVGNYYGIIGAKHDAVGGALDMYNSYATEPTVTIDGNATTLKRCILQDNLYNGSPATSNSYFSEAFKPSIGRIHFTIAQCDSTVTLDLTINNSNTSTDVVTACDSYTWIDGNTYTTSNNTATQVLSTQASCDSTVTLDLTVNNVSNISTSVSGQTIIAGNGNATYQWLDCDNNYSIIPSEINQGYTPSANGNYSVEFTENGCLDTAACVAFTTLGILENSFGNNLLVYPNPTSGNFSVDLGAAYENSQITIIDISGKLIDSKTITQSQTLNFSLKEPAGIYIVSIQAEDKKAVIRLVKK